MRGVARVSLAAVLLGSAGVAVAGPLDDAQRAFEVGDFGAAVRLLRPQAERGDPAAEARLGALYLLGEGVPQDDGEALIWLRKAAAHGDVWAEFKLGDMTFRGQGVVRDDVEAARLYREAADRGDRLAALALGHCYEGGRGVPQDFVRAYMWYDLVARRSAWNFGASDRDRVAAKMTPGQIAEGQALAAAWKPTK